MIVLDLKALKAELNTVCFSCTCDDVIRRVMERVFLNRQALISAKFLLYHVIICEKT